MRVRRWLVVVALVVAPVLVTAEGRGPRAEGPASSAQSALPTPESVLGFVPGQGRLANYEQTIAYFQKLAAAAPDRMRMVPAGTSSEGRTFYYALISSPDNLRQVDHYREIARRLAHPEGLTDAEARQLAHEGKALVHLDGGLHASEFAGPQHTIVLAYDILSHPDDPEMAGILNNVVLMLWPTINPDGQTMVADANGNFNGLYQEYVGHDNNRDAYMLDMIESRVMEYTWRQWEPEIIQVHHQGAPAPSRIWFPPFEEPIALDAPPLISAEINSIGMAMDQGLDERDLPGALHGGPPYDAWYPGYNDYMSVFQNIASYWTETAPSPIVPRETSVTEEQTRPQTLYPNPWPGGSWGLADAMKYMEAASLSMLDYAARYKDTVLYDRYVAGRDQIAAAKTKAPYAYVVPQAQHDPVAAVEMLRRLAFSGVRVEQATAPMTVDNQTFPAGTWVVPTDQEFAALARELLDVQHYPNIPGPDGELNQPYDAAGWTLPLSMGVQTIYASAPLSDEVRGHLKPLGPMPAAAITPQPYPSSKTDAAPFDSVPGIGFNADPAAAAIVPRPGKASGSGPALAVDPAENNAFRAVNETWKAGGAVRFQPATSSSGARYVLTGLSTSAQDQMVSSLALTAERTSATAGTAVAKPRIAMYNPASSMDAGWTRWLLEQYGFEYTPIAPADFPGAAPLKDRFDVIVVADERSIGAGGGRFGRGGRGGGGRGAAGGRGAGAGGQGRPTGAGQGGAIEPAPPAPSTADVSAALDAFVRAGGTLVCLNHSTASAIDLLHLPVTNSLAGVNRRDFFSGISLLNVETTPTERVMAGMPNEAAVFVDGSPAFDTGEGFTGAVLARYPATGSPLASGYLLGEKSLQGKAAALDVTLGQGHVILIGFRPQWRDQPFGTFRILFNAVLDAR